MADIEATPNSDAATPSVRSDAHPSAVDANAETLKQDADADLGDSLFGPAESDEIPMPAAEPPER